MLETVWCAVNRVSKDGVVMGEKQRVSVLQALRAVTVNAAYQYFEEDVKGSLKEGKDSRHGCARFQPSLKVDPVGRKGHTSVGYFKERSGGVRSLKMN